MSAILDPAARGVLGTVQALSADAQEHIHAVRGTLGDLRCRDSGVKAVSHVVSLASDLKQVMVAASERNAAK